MAFILKYSKAQYLAKISELEGYYGQLEQHLQRMEDLKSQMFQFWNDKNAQTTGQILAIEIRSVRSAMDRTNDMLTFYRSTVEQLGGTDGAVGDILQQALSMLSGLGE